MDGQLEGLCQNLDVVSSDPQCSSACGMCGVPVSLLWIRSLVAHGHPQVVVLVVDAHVVVHVDVGVLFGFVNCSVQVEDENVWCFLCMVRWQDVACCVA